MLENVEHFGAACPGIAGDDDKWDFLMLLAELLGWPF